MFVVKYRGIVHTYVVSHVNDEQFFKFISSVVT